MTEHTPGPWHVFPKPDSDKVTIGPVESHSNLVRCVAQCYADEPNNADLIAAAPDLLEAGEELLAEWDTENERTMQADSSWWPDSPAITALRAAIAKAKGEREPC